jgi:hypothetical protein
MDVVYHHTIEADRCFTVCQHITFRRLLPLFKKMGITHVFASHCSHNDWLLEEKYDIRILPFPIYAFNAAARVDTIETPPARVDTIETPPTRVDTIETPPRWLISFNGSYNRQYYITDVRERLKHVLSGRRDCIIRVKQEWHFHDAVYNEQIKMKNFHCEVPHDESYKKLLSESVFSLCPSGTGPGSIRFWESLSHGSIPVMLSNDARLPDFVEWDKCCVFHDDRELDSLYETLKKIPPDEITMMKNLAIEVYQKYFSHENFHHTIEQFFNVSYRS